MTSFTVDVPAMYADHHVVEVRRILSEIAGVETVTTSAAWRVVQVEYDADKTSEDALTTALDQAGYLADLDTPSESGEPAVGREDSTAYFRHTAAVETAGNTISFGQEIIATGRPLWPCPGMSPVPTMDE
jgi:copper chaperone CopZ